MATHYPGHLDELEELGRIVVATMIMEIPYHAGYGAAKVTHGT